MGERCWLGNQPASTDQSAMKIKTLRQELKKQSYVEE